jgi:hypothetical protein
MRTEGGMMGRSNLIRSVVIGLIGMGLVIALAGCAPAEDEATVIPSPIVITRIVVVEPTEDAQAIEPADVSATLEAVAAGTIIGPTPTATVVPTPSVTPTFSSVPTSTVPLAEGGPWLVFLASEDPREGRKLWAINTDGTGLTKLIDEPVYAYDILPAQTISDGLTIAYVTGTRAEFPCCTPCGLMLKIVNVPSSVVQASIPLLSADICLCNGYTG